VLGAIDLSILAGFLVWSLASGLRSRRSASRNLEEYFLAGRTLRGWQAGISMAATQFAADTPLLVTGLIATAGIFSRAAGVARACSRTRSSPSSATAAAPRHSCV
jgi:Na+/proline symporter